MLFVVPAHDALDPTPRLVDGAERRARIARRVLQVPKERLGIRDKFVREQVAFGEILGLIGRADSGRPAQQRALRARQ